MSALRDLVSLTKPRITFFVVLTAAVGFVAGLEGSLASIDVALLLHTLVGTALVASGTSAFNQLWEVEVDRRMARTRNRPLPDGRLPVRLAFSFALLVSVAGTAQLYFFANALTALLAALTLTSYVFAYTPLKTRSPLSTIVGAIPGALPPLGGYTAVTGAIGTPGLVLFAILFVWQLPHFLAIGWRHREDYGRAGIRILSTVDPTGRRSGREALLWCVALLPISLLPSFTGMAGVLYGVTATLLSGLFLVLGWRFARRTTDATALALFLFSIAWLPAILLLLVIDRIA